MVRVFALVSISNIIVDFNTLGATVSTINGSLLGREDNYIIVKIANKSSLFNTCYFLAKIP
ncbi:hypothetical protein [Candidatus Fukatsuia anoeciicola]|uniref:hypothetical protein n=1 Tax=Candidatus Fukatsuia anoeciicola TaxID=2994492 RepID=UPI003463BF0B